MTSSITMYDASVPVFKQMLTALNVILGKTQTQLISQKIAPETVLQASLFPDMFNLIRQVQIATDFAKGVTARLAGVEVPAYEDNESSFDELQARIEKTLEFMASVKPELINGSEGKEIVTRPGTPKERRFNGRAYLLNYGIPQFFFHVTTAYGVLRSQGIEIGKMDFMGSY